MKVRALKPVVGAYPTDHGADHVQTELVPNEFGNLVNVKRGYKKYFMHPAYQRPATVQEVQDDQERVKRGEDPVLQGGYVTVPADPEFLDLPADYAKNLIAQGLAEPYKDDTKVGGRGAKGGESQPPEAA